MENNAGYFGVKASAHRASIFSARRQTHNGINRLHLEVLRHGIINKVGLITRETSSSRSNRILFAKRK